MTDVARRVHRSDWIDRAAAVGLVAYGVVHLVLAWLSVQLAVGHRSGGASTTGAVRELAQQPFGRVLVWLVAVGMLLLVVWQAVEAAVGHRDDDGAARARHRVVSAGKVVVYLAILVSAVRVATRSGESSNGTDSMTARLLDLPAGQVVVAAVGVGVAVTGVVLVVKAVRGRFLERLDADGRSSDLSAAFRWLGLAGYAAKGVSLGVVGALFLFAATSHDAKKSGGLDQALRTVLDQPFGPVLLGLIGLGFAGFGLFCLVEARYLDR